MTTINPTHVLFDMNESVERLERILHGHDLSDGRIPVTRIFLARYRAFPCTVVIQACSSSGKLHVPSIRRYLEREHQHRSIDDIIKRQYHSTAQCLYITDFLADLGDGITLDGEHCQLLNHVDNPHRYSTDISNEYFLVVDRIRIHYLSKHETYVNGELASRLSSLFIVPSQSRMIQVMYTYVSHDEYNTRYSCTDRS
jgi:hypothetical protein